MFDLPKQREPINKLMFEGLKKFEDEYPNEVWSNISFDSFPRLGWVAINFDTKEKSDEVVAEFQHNGPAWYGEDKRGRFNSNCADFKYCEFSVLEIPEWKEAYESFGDDLLVSCIDASGNAAVVDLEQEGDEGLNKLVFELIKKIIVEKKSEIACVAKNKGLTARIGVQMCDSECEYFELL